MIYYLLGLLPCLGSKTHYFMISWEIPLFSIDFWNIQRAISPLVPWRLVAHFVRTGLKWHLFLVLINYISLTRSLCNHIFYPSLRVNILLWIENSACGFNPAYRGHPCFGLAAIFAGMLYNFQHPEHRAHEHINILTVLKLPAKLCKLRWVID